MMSAQSEESHDCCNKTDQHSHDSKSSCEVMCAIGSLAFTSPDSLSFNEDGLGVALAAPAGWPTVELTSIERRHDVRPPPDHSPPLFVLHAAFLI